MTTIDSSSGAESSMDDSFNIQTLTKRPSFNSTAATTTSAKKRSFRTDDGNSGDGEVWGNFTDSFRQVQFVLDRNRMLIQQVNENHQSKIADNMVKNVALIQEINENISKVVLLYSHLSENFSSVFHQRNAEANEGGDVRQAWFQLKSFQ